MLYHSVKRSATGFLVVYVRHNDEVVIVCETLTEKQANQEAARLNYEQQGVEAAALEKARAAYFRPRRAVRQFEEDAFA